MNIVKPNRVKRTYVQSIGSAPEKVFPLLCPVREEQWAAGWNPELIVTESGFAEKECCFITRSGEEKKYWIITHHDPVKFEVDMHFITPGITAGKLEIRLSGDGAAKTRASVTYSYTSLSPEGDMFVKNFTKEYYIEFMREWEKELNHYLSTGKILPG